MMGNPLNIDFLRGPNKHRVREGIVGPAQSKDSFL